MDTVPDDKAGEDTVAPPEEKMMCEVRAIGDMSSSRMRIIMAPGESRIVTLAVGEKLVVEGRGTVLMTRTFTASSLLAIKEQEAAARDVAAALAAQRKKRVKKASRKDQLTEGSAEENL